MENSVQHSPYKPGFKISFSRPETEQKAAVLFFHGGGWRYGDPMFCAPLWPQLLLDGILCATAEYSLGGDDLSSTIYDSIEDAKLAVARFVKMFPKLPKFVSGASAGGTLALLAATSDIRGCILFNPVLDLSANGFKNAMTPDGGDESISPIHLVGRHTFRPALILHGTKDTDVPISTSERYAASLPGVALIKFEGAGHGFATRPAHAERVGNLMSWYILANRGKAPTEAEQALERSRPN
jgi:acetyl esterase/lipase